MGHVGTKKLFVLWLKLKVNWCPIFLFANWATLCWGPAPQATVGYNSGYNSTGKLRRNTGATEVNLGLNQQRALDILRFWVRIQTPSLRNCELEQVTVLLFHLCLGFFSSKMGTIMIIIATTSLKGLLER